MIITMNDQEKELAAFIGDARTFENKNRADIADYKSFMFNLTSQQANRLGVLAEIAVLKMIGAPYDDEDVWIGYVPSTQYSKLKGRPDIAFNNNLIEVRRANKKSSPIPIRAKDAGYTIVQPFIKYTQAEKYGPIQVDLNVEMLGWAKWDDESVKPSWATGNSKSMVAIEKRNMEDLIFKGAGV